jgi:hypothetical protein
MITPNEKKNFITQPDDNSDQNVKNIIIQQDDIAKRLQQCYHPANDNISVIIRLYNFKGQK